MHHIRAMKDIKLNKKTTNKTAEPKTKGYSRLYDAKKESKTNTCLSRLSHGSSQWKTTYFEERLQRLTLKMESRMITKVSRPVR